MFVRIYTNNNNPYMKDPPTFILIKDGDNIIFYKISFTSLNRKIRNILKNDSKYNTLNLSEKIHIDDNKFEKILSSHIIDTFKASLFFNKITNKICYRDRFLSSDLDRINKGIFQHIIF